MFLTYKVAYHKEYLTSGQEEYKLRMELADKLRRLPLSFFGMRDLSDVTGIIMDDVQTMSHVLSQSAAELKMCIRDSLCRCPHTVALKGSGDRYTPPCFNKRASISAGGGQPAISARRRN